MAADDPLLDTLTGAILDGSPIDWSATEATAGTLDPGLVRRLKEIAALAAVHRSEMPETWGHLRLLERIGHGTFGDVYRAWDPRLDREVALKLLPADASSGDHLASAVIEEGRLLARIHHPNVVTVYGAERIGDRVGLWMEYVGGRTLHELVVEEKKRFSPQEIAEVARDLCGAVAAVHDAGLLHRDIKAQNVVISSEGRLALMDFGAGHDRSDGPTIGLAGTPLYLAPEVLSGLSGPTVQSDVYSTGVLLYFVLTGTYPVTARDVDSLRAAHERGDRRGLRSVRPDISQQICNVVERAIDPDPARRYPNTRALASAFRTVDSLAGARRASWVAGMVTAVAIGTAMFWWPSAPGKSGMTVAVLPFENLDRDPASDYFADGLTDEIIRSLSVIEGLTVPSRTSSLAPKGKQLNAVEAGKALAADYLVEGSVLHAGDQLRVTVALVRIRDGFRLWSDRFDRKRTDVFAIQDEISNGVVNSLRLKLSPGRRRYETNLEAYDLYLRGRHTMASFPTRGRPVAAAALQYFEQAIKKDPDYAIAHAGMADAFVAIERNVGTASPQGADVFPRAKAAAERAVELDPMLSEAQSALASIRAREYRWHDAERGFRHAIELNPNNALAHLELGVSVLVLLGRFEEGLGEVRRAVALDPLSPYTNTESGRALLLAGRYTAAIDQLRKAIALDPSRNRPYNLLGRALYLQGQTAEALPVFEGIIKRGAPPGGANPRWSAQRVSWHACAEVRAGHHDKAVVLLEDQLRTAVTALQLARTYACLGDKEQAFEYLEKSLAEHDAGLAETLQAPELEWMRPSARFAMLRKKVNLTP